LLPDVFRKLSANLEGFLALEAFLAAILFLPHIGNFVDAFVGVESPPAFEAFAAAPNGIANAAFP